MRFLSRVLLLGCGICSLLSIKGVAYAQTSKVAAVPPFFTYGGALGDSSGKPLTGVVGVTFSLYADQQGGAPLWVDTQNVSFDDSGRYSIVLGAAGKSLPMDLFTAGQPRWLGVKTQNPADTEQPRVLLVSVPYALKAGDADTLGGKPVSAFLLSDGVQASQLWKGAASKLPDDSVVAVSSLSGTGTQNQLAKWTDNAGTLGDSTIADVSGNVGIGTAAPGNLLHVNSGAAPSVSQFRVTANNQGSLSAITYGADNAALGFDVDYNVGFRARNATAAMLYKNGGLLHFTGNSGLTPGNTFVQTDQMVLDLTSGNFGVGATTPQSKLHVRSVNSVYSPDLLFSYDGLGNYRNGISNSFSSGGPSFNLMTFRVGDSSPLGQANVMTLNGAGNVGIGTFFPTAKLEVAGSLNVSSGTITGNGSGLTNINANQVSGNGAAITNVNAALLNGQPASAFAIRGITYLAGCDTCSVLADTDDQKTIYLNVVGNMTINAVTCYSDAGTPSINLQRDNGGLADVLSAPLSCSTTGATSTGFTTSLLNLNEKLDFVMVAAGGTAKRVTVAIKATVN